jgi:murein DD-endopeptidase MepM/ murein hydrolase activator NlpD
MGLARKVTLRSGDTLATVLEKTGIDRSTAQGVVDALRDVYDPKHFRAGQELELSYEPPDDDGNKALSQVNFSVDPAHSIMVSRLDDGTFSAKEIVADTHREFVRAEGAVETSLFDAAQDEGLPIDVLTAMVKLFSYDVDFQRDLQKGDSFAVMYERELTADGKTVRNFNIQYATMMLSGDPLKFYAFRQEDGSYDYYTEKGEGVRKALLRTPVNGAVLTSGFGLRFHPILGYSRMHRGVDFGVPNGTPIMAAGDGVIEKRGFNGEYGNYIRIRHNSEYSTAYAHMSKFAPEFSVGSHVKQGQIIGFVGHTGLATGPHLHFEVIDHNKQVNPVNVKFPASQKLTGAALARFRATQQEIDQRFAALGNANKYAQAGDDDKSH